jgi:hypothetical protein
MMMMMMMTTTTMTEKNLFLLSQFAAPMFQPAAQLLHRLRYPGSLTAYEGVRGH